MDDLTGMMLEELRLVKKELSRLREEVTTLRVDVGSLKAKSMIWGGLVGTVISGIIGTFFILIKK